MAKAYSYDLRKKVIEAIELDGFKKTEASQMFNVSRNTINLWLKRKEETGDYVEFVTVLKILIVYVMLWNLSCVKRPNSCGNCYIPITYSSVFFYDG